MKRLADLIPHAAHGFWGAMSLLFALLVWPGFVYGVHLMQNGHFALGGFVAVVNAVAGGVHLRAVQQWRQRRRTYISTLREQPIIISDSVFADVYEHFAHCAVEEFNDCGSVPSRFFAITIDNEGAIRRVIDIPEQIARQFYRGDSPNDAIKPFLHYLLDKKSPFRDIIAEAGVTAPNLVVQICEAWTAKRKAPPGEVLDMTPPCEDPDRREYIVVFVHSINRTEVGFSPIHTEPTRRAEYAPLPDNACLTWRMIMDPAPSEDATVTKN